MQDSKNGPTRTDPNSERKAESTGVVLPVADLRDYFAAKFLVGIVASGAENLDYASRAVSAYKQADAMLAARKGPANG